MITYDPNSHEPKIFKKKFNFGVKNFFCLIINKLCHQKSEMILLQKNQKQTKKRLWNAIKLVILRIINRNIFHF